MAGFASRIRDDQGVTDDTAQRESLDDVVSDLRQLRLAAGDVSYAEIANRIGLRREASGLSPAASRVARSSVFDTFRTGRSRVNADFVAEIALALGLDSDDAQRWRSRCLQARAVAPAPALPVTVTDEPRASAAHSPAFVAALIVACIGINLFGGAITARFDLPLWLDMSGTAIAAIVLGPWSGVVVGLAYNTVGALTGELEMIPFALVNVVGALVWGYGARIFGLARTWSRMLLLNTIVALTCTIAAVPINVLLLSGQPLHASSDIIATFLKLGEGIWLAVLSANLIVSIVDKQIVGFAALGAVRWIARLQRGTEKTADR